jgi:hypothetical protein
MAWCAHVLLALFFLQPKSWAFCLHLLTVASKDPGLRENWPRAMGLFQPSLPWSNVDLIVNSVLIIKVHTKMVLFNTQQIVFLYIVIFSFYMLFLVLASLPSVCFNSSAFHLGTLTQKWRNGPLEERMTQSQGLLPLVHSRDIWQKQVEKDLY